VRVFFACNNPQIVVEFTLSKVWNMWRNNIAHITSVLTIVQETNG
jgi:hypothetical protein